VDVAAGRQSGAPRRRDDARRTAQTMGIELADVEWEMISDLPATISSVMMAVSDSGLIGTVLEEGAIARAPSATARRYGANPLIKAVVAEMKAQRATRRARVSTQEPERNGPAHGQRKPGIAEVLGQCTQVADLLERRIPPRQAEEFKEWLVAIGEEVANAAAEGGFVTIGGAAESNSELMLLRSIRDALRVKA
jgi:hypothetical protein